MSDSAIIKDCLVHYDSQHIQVRKDFFDLCAYDKSKFNQTLNGKGNRVKDEPNQECMAKIVRLLETLTDSRREAWFTKALEAKQKGLQIPEPPKNIFIELTYKSICALLYDTYGESTVRNSVAELIARNFIRRRQKTNNSIPEYALNIEVIQQALKQREQDNLEGVLKSTAYKNSKRGVEINSLGVRNQQPRVLKSTAWGSEINTNNIYSNKADNTEDKKEENAHVSNDNAPTPSSLSENSSSSLQETTASETPSQSLTEATQPLSEENGTTEPALPEIEAQREEEASEQANGASHSQENTEQTSSGKGNKAEKITQSQINHVYGVLEQMFRKAYDSPEYCIPRTETATRYIKSLIKAKATPVLVQKAFKKLWDQEDKNGEHWWREPGHLTIKAFVNQYTALAPSLMSAGQTNSSTPPEQEEPEKKSVLGVAGLPRVETNKPAPKVSYVPSSVQQQRERMLGKRIS